MPMINQQIASAKHDADVTKHFVLYS